MSGFLPRLSAAQTAERLGVKPETLYAYVSRGLLTRIRTAHGSTFDALEVEAFASRRRQRGQVPADRISDGTPLMVLETSLAHVLDGELFYREHNAAELARTRRYEDVAHLLWTGEDATGEVFEAGAMDWRSAAHLMNQLPPSASGLHRLTTAVLALGAGDPLRHLAGLPGADLPMVEQGRQLIAASVLALAAWRNPEGVDSWPENPGSAAFRGDPGRDCLVSTFWKALGGNPEDSEAQHVLNTAMVLLLDHDLATSTLAVRTAASARASLSAAVISGLGALDSVLHGTASLPVAGLLDAALDSGSPGQGIAQSLATGAAGVPGFGLALYPEGDPRAAALLEDIYRLPGSEPVMEMAQSLAVLMLERTGLRPNIDFALGVLARVANLDRDAPSTIFAVARMGGWVAHYADEIQQEPLRMRPRGRYVGPMP